MLNAEEYEDSDSSGAECGAYSADLQVVVDAWDGLTDEVRAEIVGLVKGISGVAR